MITRPHKHVRTKEYKQTLIFPWLQYLYGFEIWNGILFLLKINYRKEIFFFIFFSFEDGNMKLFLVVDKKSKFTGANMLQQRGVLIIFALTVRQEMDHFAIFDIIQLLFLTWSAQIAVRVIAEVTTLWDYVKISLKPIILRLR